MCPGEYELLDQLKARLRSVLESRKWEWLSPSERMWLQEIWDEDEQLERP